LANLSGLLASCDSMAWSFSARHKGRPFFGHDHAHCGNCLEYALWWRRRIVARLP
jgi:hypothetical protein